jgi:hypothetical protein
VRIEEESKDKVECTIEHPEKEELTFTLTDDDVALLITGKADKLAAFRLLIPKTRLADEFVPFHATVLTALFLRLTRDEAWFLELMTWFEAAMKEAAVAMEAPNTH